MRTSDLAFKNLIKCEKKLHDAIELLEAARFSDREDEDTLEGMEEMGQHLNEAMRILRDTMGSYL